VQGQTVLEQRASENLAVRWIMGPLLVALAACEPPPPEVTLSEVPALFVGKWDASLGDCGQDGPNAVTVTPTEVAMENTKVAVTGVAPDGETAARVLGRFTRPGQEWGGSIRLELSADGRTLNVVNGAMFVPRVKCP
jgi:hypothetical protein